MTEYDFLNRNIFFTTRTFALFLGLDLTSSSRRLGSLAKSKDILSVTRGLWANDRHRNFSPYGAIPYLLDQEQGYLSFLSALQRHDLISQIPTSIQIATTGRGRVLKSQLGDFHFYKIKPELMHEGIDVIQGGAVYNIACAEKALLDTFYLSTKKGNKFSKLPELELNSFSEKKFLRLLKFYPAVARPQILERFRRLG